MDKRIVGNNNIEIDEKLFKGRKAKVIRPIGIWVKFGNPSLNSCL